MSLFSEHANGGKVGWSNKNISDFKRHLKMSVLEYHQKSGGDLHSADADKFIDRLLEKYEGSTRFGPGGGVNENELRRALWELANSQGDGFTKRQVEELEQIIFEDNKEVEPA